MLFIEPPAVSDNIAIEQPPTIIQAPTASSTAADAIAREMLEALQAFQKPCGVRNYEQAARYLQISTRHLKRLVRMREIGHVRSGRRVLFREPDLTKYCERNSVSASRFRQHD